MLAEAAATVACLLVTQAAARPVLHQETPTGPAPPDSLARQHQISPARDWSRGPFRSVQVNVTYVAGVPHDTEGDAANEPSICVDPTAPYRMSVGWRQFDTIADSFRQSGWATSHDAGRSWSFSGTLTPGVFGSDPVLASDASGGFYFTSINDQHLRLFRSFDSGASWEGPITVLGGFHDKEWITIDNTGGAGTGNVYVSWSGGQQFARSIDHGKSFTSPVTTPLTNVLASTIAVGPEGIVYLVDENHNVARSLDARDRGSTPSFELTASVDLGGVIVGAEGPNPAGLLGQTSLEVDHSSGPARDYIYMLGSVQPWGGEDPLDVMFARSTDGGDTWDPPVRVNDDPRGNGAWQWLAAMSVAPGGRIDVVWNDTRSSGQARISELYYAYSTDAGESWSQNVPVSPPFDSWLGWPSQDKLGDYNHTVSDDTGVDVAYAATFNGGQDVYYLRIGSRDCNGNRVPDSCETDCGEPGGPCDAPGCGRSVDCNDNGVPDECELDCNHNGVPDACDLAAGTSVDSNANSVPDECDPRRPGRGP